MLHSVVGTLPQTLVFYAAGKTDLCNARWDARYEAWKQQSQNLGDLLASREPSEQHATFIFWLDDLLKEHHMHQCWSHVLDGKCLSEQLTDGVDNMLFNVLWGMCLAVAGWLRTVSRGSQRKLVRIVCVCAAGKHRSVLLSKLLMFVFQIVFQLLGLDAQDQHGFRWVWAAGPRVEQEMQRVRQGVALHEAKQSKRQSPVVTSNVKKLFFNPDMVTHLKSMNLTDGFFRKFAKQGYFGNEDYVLDTMKFLKEARTSGATPGIRAWVDDLLTVQAQIDAIFKVRIVTDWVCVMHELLGLFPSQCSLCRKEWNLTAPWDSIVQQLLGNAQPRGVSFLTTARPVQSASGSGAAGGVTFLSASSTTAAAASSTVRSHGAVPGSSTAPIGARLSPAMPKRVAWADVEDAPATPVEKRPRRVSFQADEPAGEPHPPQQSPDATVYFFVFQCDLTHRVLLRPGGRDLDIALNDEFLLTIESAKRNFAIATESDADNLLALSQTVFERTPALQQEMLLLEKTLADSNFFPPLMHQGWCVLRRVQFLLFLHFWSVLTQDYSFFVSSPFLRLIGIPFRREKNYDVLAVMHKYCYLIWLHRTAPPERWCDKGVTFLLPETPEWQQWWQQQQVIAQEILEVAFAEEYVLMLADPLADTGAADAIKAEVEALTRRVRRADLPIPPELPEHYHWFEHDVYMCGAEALPTPRCLPCIRCTAGEFEADWGDETGEPMNVSRETSVSETDCCLVVKVPVPSHMTLHDVLGTRSWPDSFQACTLGRPYWAVSTADAGGFSAHVSAQMHQVHMHALGAEIMATLRPDSVMHPHLRSHVEFILGLFASVHLARGDAAETLLGHFLLGCGIETQETGPGEGWIAKNYQKRHKNPTSIIRPSCHTLWGEKTRPIGFLSDDPAEAPVVHLVHDPCPFKNCENHKQMMGFGTLCPYWHGFNKKHSNCCTLAAQRFLKFTNIGNKLKTM